MKSIPVGALIVAVFCLFSAGQAQDKPNKVMRVFSEPKRVTLVKGDILQVLCDSAFVYNRQAVGVLRTLEKVNDSLTTALKARIDLGDSIKAMKDTVIEGYRGIVRIQNQSHNEMLRQFWLADSLVKESTANTSEALSYIGKVKATSFLASGITGCLVGGFGLKSDKEKNFDLVGAGGGAVIGLAINYILLRVLD